MLLHISHATEYDYSAPVEIQPHVLRFKPRHDGSQLPINYQIAITPTPAGSTAQLDFEGNLVQFVWFEGKHRTLRIHAETIAETHRENPFDFLKPPTNRRIGALYDAEERERLRPALLRITDATKDDPVARLASHLAQKVHGDPVDFLYALNQEICDRIELEHRDTGEPMQPTDTLRSGSGACRDAAVLFMDACRAVGLAARFASGYHLNDDPDEANELHGWAEVYIPNAGWRGFDPSVGVLVADEHVTIAASARACNTVPVAGAYCGRAFASLQTDVMVDKLESAPDARRTHAQSPRAMGERRARTQTLELDFAVR